MRYLIGVLGPASLGAAVLIGAGCSAGTAADLGTGGTGGTSANGPSTGTGFGSGGGSTGSGPACTDPNCVGNMPQGGCDTGLAIDSANAMDGAKAIGLCKQYSAGGWGVVQADWVSPDGTPLSSADELLGKGILTHFGNVISPREGGTLLALSSGTARNPGDPGYQDVKGFDKKVVDNYPAGAWPKESPACPQAMTGDPHDSAGLRLKVHTPKDAKSISFASNFYTYEFPGFICSTFNDFFVALMNPPPADSIDGNISFDTMHNLISVNAGFLTVCQSQVASNGVNFPCAAGPGELAGTGFDTQVAFDMNFNQTEGSAATGWLETKAPVAADTEITLQFSIWDSGDGVLDSTVLIDNFKFELGQATTGTAPIPK